VSGRRWPGRDRGAFTAELAAGLPALMLLLFAGLAAVSAVAAKGQCLDAAREAALAEARGDSGTAAGARVAQAGAVVEIGGDGEIVTARVRARLRVLGANLPVINVEGTATAAREPEPVL
jgi:Flp pilus assembly protein TadG